MSHLLVTNDFPPKLGGIQAYLWELWRRLDPESFVVLTARSHPDAEAFDRDQRARGIRIERVGTPVLHPEPPAGPPDPTDSPGARVRVSSSSTPPSPSASSAPTWGCPMQWSSMVRR